MTPIERLEAAIEKLEQHSGETWHEDGYDGFGTLAVNASNSGGGRNVAGLMGPGDAHLIVTLHRTIDAQLAILRFAVDGLYDLPEFLMLADAILGCDS